MRIAAIAVVDAQGQHQGFVGFLQDDTERLEFERAAACRDRPPLQMGDRARSITPGVVDFCAGSADPSGIVALRSPR